MPKTPRRLGLLDAMILVAAVAVGLAWTRAIPKDYLAPSQLDSYIYAHFGSTVPLKVAALMKADCGVRIVSPCAACIAIASIAIRFRKTGLRRGVAVFSPGVVACASLIAVLVLQGLRLGIDALLHTEPSGVNLLPTPFGERFEDWLFGEFLKPASIGMAVVGCWSALVLTKRWKPDPTAIDRLGRVLGLYWIVAMMVDWAAEACFR